MIRYVALSFLVTVLASAVFAPWLAPNGYEHQFREHPDEPPSAEFLLGTDELGRDRFARLLYGSRVSLVLAPITALLATFLALCIAALSTAGSKLETVVLTATDLAGSVPLLFLLIGLRAVLPLDVPSFVSILLTFGLLALCGWTSGVRICRTAMLQIRGSTYLRQAVAMGCRRRSLLLKHAVAGIWPVLAAQFWLLVPQFLIAEANLGALGLGITEPVPSWGNLLLELHNYHAVLSAPWRIAPAVLLIFVLLSLQCLLRKETTK